MRRMDNALRTKGIPGLTEVMYDNAGEKYAISVLRKSRAG